MNVPEGTMRFAPSCLAAGLMGVGLDEILALASTQTGLGLSRPVVIIIQIVVLMFAIIVHEVSHGYAAEQLGDPTARRMGRLTLNPIPHIDPFGSILVPGILFLTSRVTGMPLIIGWAKPVPVDIRYFKDPLRGFAITSAAGPGSNFLQVIVYALIFRTAVHLGWPTWVQFIGMLGAWFNMIIAFFNLIPVPPLDGSRLVAAVLPPDTAGRYLAFGRYGMFVIIALVFFGLLDPYFSAIRRLLILVLGLS
ncbi:MAG: site-2 protease family protein [Candidatus Eisenbacteria bacterium]|nr:site-2 protease family protein [Candidatus Eisenbacteria bacterium]